VELIYRVSFRNKDLWLGVAILEKILSVGGRMDRAGGEGRAIRKCEDICKIIFIRRCQAPIFHYYIIIVSSLARSRAMTS
jgi:hypothetical protein